MPATVYKNVNGSDGQANTADDDFTLAAASPAIDRGLDPRTLGLPALFTPLFEADFSGEAKRPRDGNLNGTAASFTYDAAGQLLSLANKLGATSFSSFDYSYDKVGNRKTLAQQRSAVTVTPSLSYTYDNLNRLTQATRPLPANPAETFTYDPVGNRLRRDGQTTDAIFDVANRLLQDEQFCYEYDENGNQTKKTAKVGSACTGAVTTYTYDAENRLVRIDLPGGGVAEYRYDGLGRRIEKNVNGQSTRYVYDNEDIIFETDATDNILARYTHGPGIDEPLIMERDINSSGTFDANERFFYQADGLGSITDLTSSAGAVVQPYVYDSFGQIVQQNGAFVNPYTYTGREVDEESGLYYYRARDYETATGRFLSQDPLAADAIQSSQLQTSVFPSLPNPGEQHRYVYVLNNPLGFTDPFGLSASVDPEVKKCEKEKWQKVWECALRPFDRKCWQDVQNKARDCGHLAVKKKNEEAQKIPKKPSCQECTVDPPCILQRGM